MSTDNLFSELHDRHTEKEIIGALLFHQNSFVNVHDTLCPEDFYVPEHEAIYRAFRDTYVENQPVGTHQLSKLADVDVKVLACAMDGAVLGASRRSAEQIRDLARKRKIYRSLMDAVRRLPELSVEELSGVLTETAVGLCLESSRKKVLATDALVERVRQVQESRRADPGLIRGIKTGFPGLDRLLRGLRPKRMTLLVAATGFGKSTLAVNLFSNAVQDGVRCLLISTENDVDDNLDRLAALNSDLDLKDVESGHKSNEIVTDFAKRFTGKTAFISDNSPRNIHEVIGAISRYVLQHQVDLVFVDYIGEVALDGVKNENEEARLTRYSQALVEASRTLNCHIVCLAQLNRAGNGKGRPTKVELAGCFKMSMKAHSLLIFWQTEEKVDVISVDKNRQGPKGDIAVSFNRPTQRITELGFYQEGSKQIIPISTGNTGYAPNASPQAQPEFFDADDFAEEPA